MNYVIFFFFIFKGRKEINIAISRKQSMTKYSVQVILIFSSTFFFLAVLFSTNIIFIYVYEKQSTGCKSYLICFIFNEFDYIGSIHHQHPFTIYCLFYVTLAILFPQILHQNQAMKLMKQRNLISKQKQFTLTIQVYTKYSLILITKLSISSRKKLRQIISFQEIFNEMLYQKKIR